MLEQIVRHLRHIVAARGKVLRVTGLGSRSGVADMKIGDMPVFVSIRTAHSLPHNAVRSFFLSGRGHDCRPPLSDTSMRPEAIPVNAPTNLFHRNGGSSYMDRS